MVKSRAFTLIELIIVISIILLLSGLTLAYYNHFTEQKRLEAETNKLVTVLELAKKKALNSDLQNINCLNFGGYVVSFSASNYTLKLVCNPDCGENCQRIYTPTYSNISLSASNPDITFRPLYRGIDLATEFTVTLTNTSINKCKKVSVTTSGVISIESSCP